MEANQSWLNSELLNSILKSSIEDSEMADEFTIIDTKVKRAIPEGKNYSSIIYKVQISFNINQNKDVIKRSYILKKPLPFTVDWFEDKESEIYLKGVNKIEKYLNKQIASRLYLTKDNIMVMDDLTEGGFKNVEGVDLLDFNHCVVALIALAKFHAGSVLLHQRKPELVEQRIGADGLDNNPGLDGPNLFLKLLSIFREELSSWQESKQYAEEIPFIENRIKDYFKNIPNRKGLKVLNHGDFWLNNMMFRYDANDMVCDVRFIDFQLCRYYPPTYDLQYFISSSASLDVRLNRLDELLNIYLNTLNDTFLELNLSENLTKQELEEGLKEDYVIYFFGLFGTCVCLTDPDRTFTFEDVDFHEESGNRFGRMMKSKLFRKFVSPVFDDLAKKGVFSSFRK